MRAIVILGAAHLRCRRPRLQSTDRRLAGDRRRVQRIHVAYRVQTDRQLRQWLRGRPAELETFEVIRKDVEERRLWEQEWKKLDGE